jgi:hypothetical protein
MVPLVLASLALGNPTLCFAWVWAPPASGAIIIEYAGDGTWGYSGDGGAAASAEMQGPEALAFDGSGNLYIADMLNGAVRKVDTSGNISTYATVDEPVGVVVDLSGNLYVSDQLSNNVDKLDIFGNVTVFAGTSSAGYSGDGGPATSASLNSPMGLAMIARAIST